MTYQYDDHLKALCGWLKQEGYVAFLQPVNDAFQGEYTPAYAQRLPWISGFGGSAGTGVFLAEAVDGKPAALFVDGRYTIQAAQEVNKAQYHLINSADTTPQQWLAEHLPEGARVAYDPWLHTMAQVKRMKAVLEPQGIALAAVTTNPIDGVWDDQPSPPAEPIIPQLLEYSGISSEEKIAQVVSGMKEKEADAVILTLPDGVNWLLNIRGSDIPYNPLLLCYAVIDIQAKVTLFMQERQVADGLFNESISIKDINNIEKELNLILKDCDGVMCDSSCSAEAFHRLIEEAGCRLIEAADPTLRLKAVKNAVEIDGMRRAHQRDGRALTQFLAWLEDALSEGDITEISAADKLEECRRKMGGRLYRGPSFATISGSGPNGAIVHYRVSEASNRIIGDSELYLVDSGGQYLDGTTDVTRTVVNGTPTDEMKDRFTRVLKGHIAIATAKFPEGTTGSQLDVLARQYLWQDGVDYDHGTGHGVGAFLCVHEGPQRISKRGGDVPLEAGMILSNEPGYYKDGDYGIRIENLVLVVEAGKTEKRQSLLGFETLTLAPIDERLILWEMLSEDEKAWLDAYQARVADAMNTA